MESVEVDKQLRDALYDQARRLQRAAMSGRPIPMPQRTQMRGQATALYDQWLELEAARFNETAADYKTAVRSVKAALKKLNKELDDLEDVIKVLERATAVLKVVDRLLKLAVENLPLP